MEKEPIMQNLWENEENAKGTRGSAIVFCTHTTRDLPASIRMARKARHWSSWPNGSRTTRMERGSHTDRAVHGGDRIIRRGSELCLEVGRRIGKGQRIVGHSGKLRLRNQNRAGTGCTSYNTGRGSERGTGCKHDTGERKRIGEGEGFLRRNWPLKRHLEKKEIQLRKTIEEGDLL